MRSKATVENRTGNMTMVADLMPKPVMMSIMRAQGICAATRCSWAVMDSDRPCWKRHPSIYTHRTYGNIPIRFWMNTYLLPSPPIHGHGHQPVAEKAGAPEQREYRPHVGVPRHGQGCHPIDEGAHDDRAQHPRQHPHHPGAECEGDLSPCGPWILSSFIYQTSYNHFYNMKVLQNIALIFRKTFMETSLFMVAICFVFLCLNRSECINCQNF